MFDIIFRLIVNTVRKIVVARLTDVIKYVAFLRNYRTWVVPSAGVHTPESNSRGPNYRGCNSKICLRGIEKCAQTYVTRQLAYSSRYFRL